MIKKDFPFRYAARLPDGHDISYHRLLSNAEIACKKYISSQQRVPVLKMSDPLSVKPYVYDLMNDKKIVSDTQLPFNGKCTNETSMLYRTEKLKEGVYDGLHRRKR
jgi:hypothetical protein